MNSFFESIGLNEKDRAEVIQISKQLRTKVKELDYYNSNHIIPDEELLEKIESVLGISRLHIKVKMGIFDREVIMALDKFKLSSSSSINEKSFLNRSNGNEFKPEFSSELGNLFKGDCISYLKTVKSKSYDLIFADPPFNLNKFYLSEIDDNISAGQYLDWCYEWIDECIRTLKPGGSLFLWNLPKWNTFLSSYLNNKLLFRHWISVDIKYSLPISGKLYPSHYSLLYYSKGKPRTFKPDRLPMEVCKNCFSDIKDYGGYKNKMNPYGINLTDVWYDIPPVRHNKYKRRKEANELSIKLIDRIIEMSTEEGDMVFDPFGGSGTTYIVAELKGRKWEGIELGPIDDIVNRFKILEEEKKILNKYRNNYNHLFPPKVKAKRMQLKMWTDESF